ncbi:MAG TPA: hypothetical protein ACFYEG_06385, partial [Candidatus Wujingus californicus]|uniref:hypothetical protein n=1 Tax=Candidatus Wujingus californicus TaxID=3367618 RepID=UPI004029CC79
YNFETINMYCRYENKGYCELNKKECVPTSMGCIIKNADNITLISKVQRSSAKDKNNNTIRHKE